MVNVTIITIIILIIIIIIILWVFSYFITSILHLLLKSVLVLGGHQTKGFGWKYGMGDWYES